MPNASHLGEYRSKNNYDIWIESDWRDMFAYMFDIIYGLRCPTIEAASFKACPDVKYGTGFVFVSPCFSGGNTQKGKHQTSMLLT